MKRFIFLMAILLNSATVFGQFAEFSFDKKVVKFPETIAGKKLEMDFAFTNTGNVPMIISDYRVTCHCTTVDFSDDPILPGQKGKIHVTFDSEGKIGWQYRVIQLYANTKKEVTEVEFRVKIKDSE